MSRIDNLIVLRDISRLKAKNSLDLLKVVVCSESFVEFVIGCLRGTNGFRRTGGKIAIPQQWLIPNVIDASEIVRYGRVIPCGQTGFTRNNSWFVISDGRVVTEIDNQLIHRVLANSKADVIAVNADEQLKASYEKIMTTSGNEVVGFRLFYEDAVRLMPIPDDWPHHLFVRFGTFNKPLAGQGLPSDFDKLIVLCSSKSLVVESINIGGSVLDLTGEKGLLKLMCRVLNSDKRCYRYGGGDLCEGGNGNDAVIAASARLFGKVLLGKGVSINENAVIVGPAIVGNNVKIGKNAVVRSSVICSEVFVPAGELVEEKVLTNNPIVSQTNAVKNRYAGSVLTWGTDRRNNFRYWPKFSYVRFFKRVFDIAASVIVLILFVPVLPIVMLAIKLNSPGPIFFRDERQGLHGKAFKCLKFRTMKVGAAGMQERLRVLNQVDGPQFMMADDPRMSAVGRFLRETFIDEIPQFVNVLLGQMSVVGPRPSPESENRLCPLWRDARLSVRPGITGLWQICRTRQPMKDFQEWIHFDVEYVRELSLKLDLWICLKTAKKMVEKFIRQF